MIIEAPYTIGDVITLKLTSGEEVVGRLQDNQDHKSVYIKKPVTFMMGAQGLGLVPFAFSAPQDVTISFPENVIICKFKTDQIVAKQYIQQTTGLTL